MIRSGKDFDITVTRVAASNPLIKDSFTEVFQQSEWENKLANYEQYIQFILQVAVALFYLSAPAFGM